MSLSAIRRRLQDITMGVSIACIFRKYQKKASLTHAIGDGKTLHSIRRYLGTEMTASGILVDVVAQVLGHKGMKATKQYISADLRGMKNCMLGFDSLGHFFHTSLLIHRRKDYPLQYDGRCRKYCVRPATFWLSGR